jgi:hypothetical protein
VYTYLPVRFFSRPVPRREAKCKWEVSARQAAPPLADTGSAQPPPPLRDWLRPPAVQVQPSRPALGALQPNVEWPGHGRGLERG